MKPNLFSLSLAFALLALGLAPPAQAAPLGWESQMNYQGLLTDSSGMAVADGTYNVTFIIYNDPIANGGGNVVWSGETQAVTTSKGLFNVYLGELNNLPVLTEAQLIGSDFYLSVQIQGELAEMLPRQKLLPAFFARTAANVMGKIPGLGADNLVYLDGTGKIPPGLVSWSSAQVPLNVIGLGGNYAIRGHNQSGGLAYGIQGQGQTAGIHGIADLSSGSGVLGQTYGGGDSATSAGVRGTATNGYGVYGSTGSSGGFGGFFEGNVAGIAVKGQAPAGVTFGTLGDKINDAGAYGAGGAGSHGVRGQTSGPGKYGVYGSNLAGGTGIYGDGDKGVHGVGGTYGVHGVASTYGGYFEATSGSYGVFALAASGGIGVSGSGTWGVRGTTIAAGGRGLYGDGTSLGYGVYATNNSTTYQTIYGSNSTGTALHGTTGGVSYYGVEGRNTGSTGVGVYGFHSSTGAGAGVRGESAGTSGRGVHGRATGTTGQGVYGEATVAGAKGVFGENSNATPNASTYGVHGRLVPGATNGYAVYGENGDAGVYGTTADFAGVWAVNTGPNYGLVADSPYDAIWARMTGGGTGYGIFVDFAGNGGAGIHLAANNAGAGHTGINVNFGGTGNAAGKFNSTAATGTKYAVWGVEASSGANAAGGRFESTNASGTVYGAYATANVANPNSVGVYGSGGNYGVQAVGGAYGVRASGSSYAVYGLGGTYGVYGSGTSYGVYGQGGSFGVRGDGPSYGVYGTSNGIYAILGEYGGNSAGSAAGYFNTYGSTGNTYGAVGKSASNGTTYGIYGWNSHASNVGYAVYGKNDSSVSYTAGVLGEGVVGLRAKADNYGIIVDPLSTPLNGRGFSYDQSPPVGSSTIGVFSQAYCSNCYAGYFTNTSGTATNGGYAMYITGRIYVGTMAGIFTFPAGVTTYQVTHSYIDSSDEVLITPKEDPLVARYWISAVAAGSFTVNTSSAPASAITFSYFIVGD